MIPNGGTRYTYNAALLAPIVWIPSANQTYEMTVEKTAKKRMLSTISWLNSGIPESMSSYADHGVRMKNPTTDAHTVS